MTVKSQIMITSTNVSCIALKLKASNEWFSYFTFNVLFIPSYTFLQKNVEENDGNMSNSYHIEYDQAPRTPGLLEEPNLANIQETSACDDHLEIENYNLTEFAARENLENASSNSDIYPAHKNVMNGLSRSGVDPDTVSVFSALGDHVGAIAVENDSSVNTCLEPSIPDGVEDVQDGIVCNYKPHINFADKTCEDYREFQEVGPKEHNFGTPSLSNTCEPVSGCILMNNGTSYKAELSDNVENAGDIVQSCPHVDALKSNADSNGTSEHEKSETREKTEKSRDMLEPGISVHENVACTEETNHIESSVTPTESCLVALERGENPLSVKLSTGVQG